MNTNRTGNNPISPGPHLSDETLNDLASGRLDEAARAAALGHLAACPECAAAARDDALIRSLLRELPTPRPSRSFQLSEEQALANPRPRRFPSLASSLPALRAATIAVALLLLAVAGTDWLTRPSGNDASTGHYAALAALTPTAALEETSLTSGAAETAATQAPMAKSANSGPTEIAASNPAPNVAADSEALPPGSASDSSAASMAGAAAPPNAAANVAANRATSPIAAATAPKTPTPRPSPTPSPAASPTPAPTVTPAAVAASLSEPDRTGWRLAELGLGLLLLWLIVTYAGAWQTSRKRG